MTRLLALFATLLLAPVTTAQIIQYCTVTTSGTSCGPVLTATMTPLGAGGNYELDLTATGLHAHAAGVMSWGVNPISVPLPGGCSLLCDYIWGHRFQTDASGQYSWGRSWPHWAIGYFYIQMGSIAVVGGNVSILTTDCKLVQCF